VIGHKGHIPAFRRRGNRRVWYARVVDESNDGQPEIQDFFGGGPHAWQVRHSVRGHGQRIGPLIFHSHSEHLAALAG
jgi:hypothetical protein